MWLHIQAGIKANRQLNRKAHAMASQMSCTIQQLKLEFPVSWYDKIVDDNIYYLQYAPKTISDIICESRQVAENQREQQTRKGRTFPTAWKR